MFSKNLSASFLILIVIAIFNLEKSNGDINTNCKRKVRDMWMNFCINEGVSRSKRGAFELQSSENLYRDPLKSSSTASRRSAANRREVAEMLLGRSRAQKIPVPAVAFPAPASGDDLHMGLTMSHNEMEELCDEMMDRFPRGAKDKANIMKMITAYAVRCCNENLDDANCSNPVDVIKCP